MKLYRKKPVVIEAVQFLEGFYVSRETPGEFVDAVCREPDLDTTFVRPHIHTLEGPHFVTVGDWIIKGVKGEFYPCKSDIFNATYEVA